jgi:hypothetical protein
MPNLPPEKLFPPPNSRFKAKFFLKKYLPPTWTPKPKPEEFEPG